MRLLILFDHRFVRHHEGGIHSRKSYNYEFFESRYLNDFDSVEILARVENGKAEGGVSAVEGPNVSIIEAPHWDGPTQSFLQRKQILACLEEALRRNDVVIGVAPGLLASLAGSLLGRSGRPYGLEVVGDPNKSLARGAMRHWLRIPMRVAATRQMRSVVAGASAVSYVTEKALQKSYPANPHAFSVGVSDVVLPSEDRPLPDLPLKDRDNVLVFVGTFEQLYKAPDIMIKAFAVLRQNRKVTVKLKMIGDGQYRSEMAELAMKLGVADHVQFTGNLSRDRLMSELDSSKVFVMPSRQEGLPRAMVEAMSRGLPCIGADVGGIPELIHDEDLVPSNDVEALAAKMHEVLDDPNRLHQMSLRNLERSKAYQSEVLQARRVEMYSHLKEATLEWRQKHGR